MDQNLKLQQGINERIMGNLMQQQMPQTQIQNTSINLAQNVQNTQNTIQQQSNQENLQNEAILTLNPTKHSELKNDTKESNEREPEFTKYVKQLKVLH